MIEQLIEVSANIGKKASQGFYHTRSTLCAEIENCEAMHHFKTAVSLKYDNPALAVRIIEAFQSSTFQPQAFCFAHHSFHDDEVFLHGSYVVAFLRPEFNGSYQQLVLFTRFCSSWPVLTQNALSSVFPYLSFPGYHACNPRYPGIDYPDGHIWDLDICPLDFAYNSITPKSRHISAFFKSFNPMKEKI